MVLDDNRWGGAASYPIAIQDVELLDSAEADPSVVVAVIDTGVVPLDGELAEHLVGDVEANVDQLPTDGQGLGEFDGHGTFVASRVLAMAPRASLLMLNTLDESVGGSDEKVAAAIEGLRDMPEVRVANLSFFGLTEQVQTESPAIGNALAKLIEHNEDIVIVTAAGNHGTSDPVWPAAYSRRYEQVLAIGAVDESVTNFGADRIPPIAVFSAFGPYVSAFASGVQVAGYRCVYRELTPPLRWVAQNFTGMCRWSGTSFAAAAVTGLITQQILEGHTGAEAREIVLRASKKMVTDISGYSCPYIETGR